SSSSEKTFSLIGPDGSISAPIESSVTLPCALSPSFSAVPLQVRWYRPGSYQKPILSYKNNQVQSEALDPHYKGRTSLVGDLKKGHVSLRLTNLTFSDRGQYVCYVKSNIWYSDLYISLTVRVIGSTAVVSPVDVRSGHVNITCESEGWSPQPTVTWRDSRGTHISSNSSGTYLQTDEDGLVSVRSWLLFSPSHSEWLSCSVGLSDQETTQSRVALHSLTTSAEDPTSGSWKDPLIIVLFLVLLGVAVCFAVHYRKASHMKHQASPYLSVPTAAVESGRANSQNREDPTAVPDAAEHTKLKTKDNGPTMEVVVTTTAVNLTLDIETVPPFLKVNEDNTLIYCPDGQKLPPTKTCDLQSPDGPSTETALPHALCDRCFKSGKHYWEVKVEKDAKQSWYVGVCSKDVVHSNRVALHPDNGFWVLHYETGIGLFANTEPPTRVPVKDSLKTVGVFLDCDDHTLTFYNADKSVCLCYLYVPQNVMFIPLISPGVREQGPVKLHHRTDHQDSDSQIFAKLRDLKPPREYWVDLHLNTTTVPPCLRVEGDRAVNFCSELGQDLGYRGFNHALCNDGFSSGKHYWEVKVWKLKEH
ncbi:butyrophilin subfamily 1 member A1-like, partial [Engraulis encrasicolus]|uniref:butyrophilin subfamily 1 member A1-like n=1 Tax=Engraulis encrasicolus TaxID=184585 RepID=UPI002FCECD75